MATEASIFTSIAFKYFFFIGCCFSGVIISLGQPIPTLGNIPLEVGQCGLEESVQCMTSCLFLFWNRLQPFAPTFFFPLAEKLNFGEWKSLFRLDKYDYRKKKQDEMLSLFYHAIAFSYGSMLDGKFVLAGFFFNRAEYILHQVFSSSFNFSHLVNHLVCFLLNHFFFFFFSQQKKIESGSHPCTFISLYPLFMFQEEHELRYDEGCFAGDLPNPFDSKFNVPLFLNSHKTKILDLFGVSPLNVDPTTTIMYSHRLIQFFFLTLEK